jgi:hypothetical protein
MHSPPGSFLFFYAPLAVLAALGTACSGDDVQDAIEEEVEDKCKDLAEDAAVSFQYRGAPTATKTGYDYGSKSGDYAYGTGTSTGYMTREERERARERERKRERQRERERKAREKERLRLQAELQKKAFDQQIRDSKKKCEKLVEEAIEVSAEIDPEGTLEVLEDWDVDEEDAGEELLEDLIDMLEDGA